MQNIYNIYCIKNVVNSKEFYGVTKTPIGLHFSTSKYFFNNKKNDRNKLFQGYSRYGLDNFYIENVFKTDMILKTDANILLKKIIYDNNSAVDGFNGSLKYASNHCKTKTNQTKFGNITSMIV
jgi:hypothetical protein